MRKKEWWFSDNKKETNRQNIKHTHSLSVTKMVTEKQFNHESMVLPCNSVTYLID